MKDWANIPPPDYFCGGDEPNPFTATEDLISFRFARLKCLAEDANDDVASYQAWLADTELRHRMKYWSMLSEQTLLSSGITKMTRKAG